MPLRFIVEMVHYVVSEEQTELGILADKEHTKKLSQVGYRVFDVVFAILTLILLFPLLLVLLISIKLSSEGPIFYKQKRIGQYGRYFYLFKFRTMMCDADEYLFDLLDKNEELRFEYAKSHKLKADPRVTRIGRFLRRTSLDELPQLINVLRGEMSVVGPRPIVDMEVPKYGNYSVELFSVRPGITGLWQVSGRSDTTYEERVFFDTTYIRNKSFGLNLHIILLTIPAIIRQKGAY